MHPFQRRAIVLALAVVIDRAAGEPPSALHPVVWMGRITQWTRRGLPHGWQHTRRGGVVLVVSVVGVALWSGAALGRLARHAPLGLSIIIEALLLKPLFAVRALHEHGVLVHAALDAADLPGARNAVGRIVSRDVATLDTTGVASAAIESLAENASDSAVGAWLAYALGGLPLAAAYRAINTLDARVGYRSEGAFGAPAARIDDVANLVPSRTTAVLIALASARPRAAWQGARREHGATASPNGGWPMATAAHALDVRLEKAGHHVLHADGRAPAAADVPRAIALTDRALLLGAAAICALLAISGRSRR